MYQTRFNLTLVCAKAPGSLQRLQPGKAISPCQTQTLTMPDSIKRRT